MYMGFVPVAASFNFPRSMIQRVLHMHLQFNAGLVHTSIKIIGTVEHKNGKILRN